MTASSGPAANPTRRSAPAAAQPGQGDVVAAVDGRRGRSARRARPRRRARASRPLLPACARPATRRPRPPTRPRPRSARASVATDGERWARMPRRSTSCLPTARAGACSSASPAGPRRARSRRSAASTTAGSWVATTTIAPRAASARSWSITCSRLPSSSSLVGSSASRISGLTAKRAGTGHPLHLAARELLDLPVAEVADVEAGQLRRRPARRRRPGSAPRARSAIATFSRALRIGTRP